jgi:signal transduction histidine kinase
MRLDILVAEHVDDLQPLADDRRSTVELWTLEPVTARVDPDGMRLVLTNIIDNALRYASGRAIEVRVTHEAGVAEILLDDSGPGIPVHDRERVLRPFERLDFAIERYPTGSGIGLAVVHELVKAMNGQVSLEDSPLGGLRVRIRLAGIADANSNNSGST